MKKITILLIFIALAFVIGNNIDISQESIRNIIESAGIYGPLLFITIYALCTVFFIPGTPLTIASGLFFGGFSGTIYTVIGATIGAHLAFLFARYFGQDYITKLLHKVKGIEKYNDKLESNGFMTTMFFRLVPIFPFNALNFALGLTKVNQKDYLIATFIGIIPGSFVLANIGGAPLGGVQFFLYIGLFVIMSFIPYFYNKFKSRLTIKQPTPVEDK